MTHLRKGREAKQRRQDDAIQRKWNREVRSNRAQLYELIGREQGHCREARELKHALMVEDIRPKEDGQ